MTSEFDVIIVGGGAAGVGAARRLAASRASTLLLEASSLLGGRAYTQDLNGYPLDLGAASGCTRATATPGSASPSWSLPGRPE